MHSQLFATSIRGAEYLLIPLLVASTELPDGGYSIGSAEAWVQDFLADMLETNFEEADAPLSEAFRRLDSEKSDAGLDQVYLRMFRGFRHRERQERRRSPAVETIFARLVSILSTKSAEQGSTDLLEFLRHDAIHYIDLIERHLDGLLGALAIPNEERTSEVASFLQLELPPNPLAALEASRRKQHLYWLVSAVAKLLGEAAEQRPETVDKALVETLQKISDDHDACISSNRNRECHSLPRMGTCSFASSAKLWPKTYREQTKFLGSCNAPQRSNPM